MKNSLLFLFALLLGSSLVAQQRKCNTMENQARLEALDPHLAGIRARIEAQTQAFVDQYQDLGQDVVYNIPVVVHVVYNNATQNISDAQILSQITVLNNDFRRLNADKVNTPAAFAGVAVDCEVNFCLATIDPTGAATTGITRTSTATTSFIDDDLVKSNATGGKTPWDATKYLNLWVCPLGGGLLGYAQFPGGPTATDGVVINYTAFGTSGTATAPFNLGRTATHEVGHWLNLYHIWGDDCGQGNGTCSAGTECSGSDAVTDTPNQCEMVYGNPGIGVVRTDGCTTTSPGVMFQNYMDYTDDAAMNMYTAGQKARMVSVLGTGGPRASLQTSTGCGVTATYCTSAGGSTADEWIQSVAIGTFTNSSGNNSGYGNYTGTNVAFVKGTAYSFTLTPGFTSTSFPEYWKIWMDLNNDKDFADAGELLYDAGTTSTTARTGTITVPTTATATTSRMRISMKYNAAPTECEAFSYGEVEDYGVTLSSAVACGNPSALASSAVTSSGATLSWTGVTGATSYNIQYKINGGATWTTTTSTSASKVLTGLTAATIYNWQVQAVCSGGSSAYVVGANFTTLAATCTDSYEANETQATAKTLAVNTNGLAKICTATDIDYFKVTTLTAAPKLKVTVTTLPADYDVVLYNSAGVQIGSSANGGTTSESITYNTATTGAVYYIKVFGYSGAFNTTTSYTVRASTQAANWRGSGAIEPVVGKDLSGIIEDVMQVYPNPVAQNLFVNYTTLTEGDAALTVTDLSGRVILRRDVTLAAGSNIIDFSVSDIADGMYLVRVQAATGSRIAKVQVMH